MGGTRVKIAGEALRERSHAMPDWKPVDEHHLAKTFLFPDFATALAFVNKIGDVAEAQGHHPDIHLGWGKVEVETWTHDAGGITERDYQLAEAIDQEFFRR